MVKKFMCIKHAEDCYALEESIRFVSLLTDRTWLYKLVVKLSLYSHPAYDAIEY